MKKFTTMAALAAAIIGITSLGAASLAGCNGAKNVEVSTFDELVAEENKGAKITLTADIDCEGETFASLTFKEIDGNGHTISHGYVDSSSCEETGGALFGRDVEVIKNLTVENFKVEGSYSGAIIKYGGGGTIDNVTVKNCTLDVDGCYYAGGIYAGYAKPKTGFFGGSSESEFKSATVKNCRVEKLTLTAESEKEHSNFGEDEMFVGAVGGDNLVNVENCSATECTITATSKHCQIYPTVGGLFGKIDSASGCYAYKNNITGSAPYWVNSSFSDTTSLARVGGFAGRLTGWGTVEYCYSSNNTILAKSTGTLYAGGFGGSCEPNVSSEQPTYIKQCYSYNNDIEGDTFVEQAKSCKDYRYIGGFAGWLKNIDVESCYSYQNTIYDKSQSLGDFDNGSNSDTFRYGGLVGSASSANFKKCASYVNHGGLDDWHFDMFCVQIKSATNCYTTVDKDYDQNNPANNVTEIDADEWKDGQGLMTKLSLTGDKWYIDSTTGLPFLDL